MSSRPFFHLFSRHSIHLRYFSRHSICRALLISHQPSSPIRPCHSEGPLFGPEESPCSVQGEAVQVFRNPFRFSTIALLSSYTDRERRPWHPASGFRENRN